jgi:hypothetical protein
MLSVVNLFEAVLNIPQAQSPMAGTREYIANRMASLKKAFSMGRIPQAEYVRQVANLQKNRNNKGAGVTEYF